MTIAITGITGLLGRHVAALARRRGHTVIGFSRNPGPDARRFTASEPPDLNGCDAVIHLAGESVIGLWTPAKQRAIRDSRVLGTRRIVEAIRATTPAPRVLVSASGTGIYNDTGDTAADEGFPHSARFLAEVSEAWEGEALAARKAGVRVVLLRTSMVLARDGGALAAMLPVFRLGLGGKLGSGRQWVAWIHIEDHAALILAAVENDSMHGPVNATAPNPVRNADFTRTLAQALHRPAFLPVPAFAVRAAMGGFSAELLENRRILPAAAAKAGFHFQFPHLPEALENLLATK